MRMNSFHYTYPGKKSTVTDFKGKEKVAYNPEKTKFAASIKLYVK
jgi:hypothetical protein